MQPASGPSPSRANRSGHFREAMHPAIHAPALLRIWVYSTFSRGDIRLIKAGPK